MKFPEPAVLVSQQQMDVFDQIAGTTGSTGAAVLKDILKKVLESLEQAHVSPDPLHGSFASVVPVTRGANNVIRLVLKG